MARRGRRKPPRGYAGAHPFKKPFRRGKIRLWELRNYTGVSESKLSRYLNGIDPMPGWLERELGILLGFDIEETTDSKLRPSNIVEILNRTYGSKKE